MVEPGQPPAPGVGPPDALGAGGGLPSAAGEPDPRPSCRGHPPVQRPRLGPGFPSCGEPRLRPTSGPPPGPPGGLAAGERPGSRGHSAPGGRPGGRLGVKRRGAGSTFPGGSDGDRICRCGAGPLSGGAHGLSPRHLARTEGSADRHVQSEEYLPELRGGGRYPGHTLLPPELCGGSCPLLRPGHGGRRGTQGNSGRLPLGRHGQAGAPTGPPGAYSDLHGPPRGSRGPPGRCRVAQGLDPRLPGGCGGSRGQPGLRGPTPAGHHPPHERVVPADPLRPAHLRQAGHARGPLGRPPRPGGGYDSPQPPPGSAFPILGPVLGPGPAPPPQSGACGGSHGSGQAQPECQELPL